MRLFRKMVIMLITRCSLVNNFSVLETSFVLQICEHLCLGNYSMKTVEI